MDAFCVSCRSWSKGSLKNKENELLCLFFKCLHLYVNSVCFFGGGGRYYTGRKPLLLRSVNGAIKSCNSPFSILTRLVLSSNFRKLSFWILCPPMAILLASPRVQKPAFLFVVDVRYSFLYLFIGFSCIFFLNPFSSSHFLSLFTTPL